jgi:hypothetical protein
MCTVLPPSGDNPIAVDKYINYHLYYWGDQIERNVTGGHAACMGGGYVHIGFGGET